MNEQDLQAGRAFEYVCGSLSDKERAQYEALLEASEEERDLVRFWQEQLLALDKQAGEIPPDPKTWEKIAAATRPHTDRKRAGPTLFNWYAWAGALVAIVLLAVLLKPVILPPSQIPNTDYIAVLTDPEGEAVLTALTTATDQQLWLQWEREKLASRDEGEGSLQLWAVSKRDGQVRSLAIFDDTQTRALELDEARFRLVTDSAFLLLTREEAGGSAIDEPSEDLLARGVCVRFEGDEA